jgi:hypothetical protein
MCSINFPLSVQIQKIEQKAWYEKCQALLFNGPPHSPAFFVCSATHATPCYNRLQN